MKTSNEAMQIMSDQLEGLINKTISTREASAVVNTIGKMISLQKLDLAFAKATNQKPSLKWLAEASEEKQLDTRS